MRLFQDEQIYSDLYLTLCEWPGDSDKVIVFGFKWVAPRDPFGFPAGPPVTPLSPPVPPARARPQGCR